MKFYDFIVLFIENKVICALGIITPLAMGLVFSINEYISPFGLADWISDMAPVPKIFFALVLIGFSLIGLRKIIILGQTDS
ncbi:MAG: hypothetical protein WC146_02840 [Patescibacteria group bacterium]|jgi:hypothetical protein